MVVLYRLFWVLLALFASSVAATETINWQSIKVHSLYLNQDVNTDRNFVALRDQRGFMWIGSDNGLKRYDGYNLRVFRSNPLEPGSIGANTIPALVTDKSGYLWAGANNLNKYDHFTESFETWDVSDSQDIWSMHVDSQGILWFGGEGFGLRGFDTARQRVTYQFFTQPTESLITDIEPVPNTQRFWVALSDGAALFDAQTLQVVQKLDVELLGSAAENIEDLLIDQQGTLWIAGHRGLSRYFPSTGEVVHFVVDPSDPNALSTEVLWSLSQDSEGRIWIGTDKMGVHIVEPGQPGFRHIPSSTGQNALPVSAIQNIYEDEQGAIWFTSTDFGLFRMSPSIDKFDIYRHSQADPNSLLFDNVSDLHQTSDGYIWIGTDGGGLNRFDPEQVAFTPFLHDSNNPNSLASNSILAIDSDDSGALWIGMYAGGFNRLDPLSGEVKRFDRATLFSNGQRLANDNIFRVFVDPQQRIWLSVWRAGLQIYDPKDHSLTSYLPSGEGADSGIKNFSINDIEPAGDGSYWIGGHSGLERFYPDENRFERIAINHVETVTDIYVGEGQFIWLATSGGLIRLNKDSYFSQHFDHRHGLSNDFILSIEEDETGALWLATRYGLNRFEPDSFSVSTYTKSEGLASNQFSPYSHLRTSDQTLYFGSVEGLNAFKPSEMRPTEYEPNVLLTRFEINQSQVELGDGDGAQFQEHVSFLDSVTLSAEQKDLTFEFSALDFSSPSKIVYRYRLDGLEHEWNQVDAQGRLVRYTNLEPGSYRFEVHATNSEGMWSRHAVKLDIVIEPPWWTTLTAKIAYGFGALLLVWGIVWFRSRQSFIRALALEKEVEDRTRQLYATNEELEAAINNLKNAQGQLVESEKMAALGGMVAGIAHEVNTPLGICLTSVSYMQDMCRGIFAKFESKQLKSSDFTHFRKEMDSGIELAMSNIYRATELIRSFKQVAVDQSAELLEEFCLDKIIQDSVNTTAPQLRRKNITVHFDTTSELQMVSYPGAISQILINLIVNSLTHGFENKSLGHIYIEYHSSGSDVRIRYRDDGVGIAAENKQKIFEPFFTTQRSQGSTGLGMHIVYNLVTQQLAGTVELKDSLQGVEFVFVLPIKLEKKSEVVVSATTTESD